MIRKTVEKALHACRSFQGPKFSKLCRAKATNTGP
jgi:hypothetical protein